MTLVEIMVVIAIIGLVTAVVGTSVYGAWVRAEVSTAQTQLGTLRDNLEQYRVVHRRYPTAAEGLAALATAVDGQAPIMEKVPADPWGNAYAYSIPSSHGQFRLDVWSFGPDRLDGTADDIGTWNLP